MSKYHDVKVKTVVWVPIDSFMSEHGELGFRSTSDFFVRSAVAAFARLKETVAREPVPEPEPESEPYEHPSSRTKRLRREAAALASPSPPASVEGPATPTSRPGRRRTPRGRVADEVVTSSLPPPVVRADVVPAPTREASLSTPVAAEGEGDGAGAAASPGASPGTVAAKPAAAGHPRPPPPPKGLDLRRVEAYVRQFTGSAKDHYPGDAQGQRLFLQGCVKRAAEMQLVYDLDDAAAGAILEDLKVVVK